MFHRPVLSKVTRIGLALVIGAVATLQVACGTILHPERKGQTGGNIDPGIAILDGLGLLLFVIPGLIAFAVDFSNGTIYLPPGESADADAETDAPKARVVHVDPDELTREKLAAVIEEHTGRSVTLTEKDMQILRQQSPDAALSEINKRTPNHDTANQP